MALNKFTLLSVLMMSNAVMAGALWAAFADATREGLGKWGASLFAQACAWAIFAAYDVIPADLIFVAGSFMLSASFMMQAAALMEFHRRTLPVPWLVAAPVVVAGVLMAGSHAALVPIGDLLQGLCCLAVFWQVCKGDIHHQRRTRMLMMIAYGLLVAMFFTRSLLGVIASAVPFVSPESGLPAGLGYLLAIATVVLSSFGFLLMHKERAEDEMHKLATVDPLTGVFNRRTFIELAERELARCRRGGLPLRLLMLDMDHFKRVNDTLGHLVGDDVLREFARKVGDCLRREDLLVRYGGEEFCVLLPGSGCRHGTDSRGSHPLDHRQHTHEHPRRPGAHHHQRRHLRRRCQGDRLPRQPAQLRRRRALPREGRRPQPGDIVAVQGRRAAAYRSGKQTALSIN